MTLLDDGVFLIEPWETDDALDVGHLGWLHVVVLLLHETYR